MALQAKCILEVINWGLSGSGHGRHAASHVAVCSGARRQFHTHPCKSDHMPAARYRGMPPTRSRLRVSAHRPAGTPPIRTSVFTSAALWPVDSSPVDAPHREAVSPAVLPQPYIPRGWTVGLCHSPTEGIG